MPENQEKDVPTREEYIVYMNETIELTKLRVDLQELQTRIAVGRAEEMRALAFLAQIQGQTRPEPPEEDEQPVTASEKTRTLKKD